jgi:hypothetical protein
MVELLKICKKVLCRHSFILFFLHFKFYFVQKTAHKTETHSSYLELLVFFLRFFRFNYTWNINANSKKTWHEHNNYLIFFLFLLCLLIHLFGQFNWMCVYMCVPCFYTLFVCNFCLQTFNIMDGSMISRSNNKKQAVAVVEVLQTKWRNTCANK